MSDHTLLVIIALGAALTAVAAIFAANKLERIHEMIEERLLEEARARRRLVGPDADLDDEEEEEVDRLLDEEDKLDEEAKDKGNL